MKRVLSSFSVIGLGLVALVSCSQRAQLNRPLFETDACAALMQFILADIPEETKAQAQIAYLSFGDFVADAASPEFLQRLQDASSLTWVDGKNFRDKEFAGKRYIVDTSTDEELTPLMLQVRTITNDGTSYTIEAAWAFKEMLSRKIYNVDTTQNPAVISVIKEIASHGLAPAEKIEPTEPL